MRPELLFFLVLLLGYGVGSIPFSLLIAKWVKGIDLRQVGSGNVGATNVGRAIGWKWGFLALLLDALKGLLPTAFLPQLLQGQPSPLDTHLAVLAGAAAILGHLFPIWLGFRGGKGVATALGVILVLAPWGTLCAAVAFLLLVGITRIVSIGSIMAALSFALFELVRGGRELWSSDSCSLGVFSVVVPLAIIVMHRSNIRRLLDGNEPGFGSAKKAELTGDGDSPS
ncbi:MAG: glycerol-3-phosphate 1-O-acyltransferase PlsY [Planctomycetaceae bacterium]|nr:glycerol-3-phosphate 1-O-acyltransferase PlsY [Planctomycetaceae bacterium]MCB9952271.1 glycerol-3-phosphate 1-O-acyltransferase PlsY [Planctomycetaceae bacterium]